MEHQLPIKDRIEYVVKEKEDRLHRKRMEAELAQKEELTFQPKVNDRSKRMAELRATDTMGSGMRRRNSFASFQPNGATVSERLYKDAADRMEKQLFANDYPAHAKSTMTQQAYSTSLKDFHER